MTDFPTNYARDANRLAVAIEEWIAIQSVTRCPDLRFHDWGRVCYIGALQGAALDHLAASPDARAMLEWADQRSGHKATLLMACVALERLGIKPPNTRSARPTSPVSVH
jgi:hypothetical protein